jgi:O-antigen ligase
MAKVLIKRLVWDPLSRGRNRSYDTESIRAIAGTALAIAFAWVIGTWVAEGKWAFLAAIAAAPLAIWWPVQTALGLFAFVVPFDTIAIMGGDSGATTLTFFVGAASAGLLLVTGLATGRFRTPPRSALWWSLLMLWCAVTYLWSIDPATSLSRMPTAAALLLIYLLSSSYRLTEAERRRVVVLAVLGGFLAALFVVKEFYQGVSIAGSDRASLVVGGQEADPNLLAAGLLPPISMAMALFFSSQKRMSKVLAMLAVGVIGLCIFLSMSRGAALGLLVIAVIYLLRLKKWGVLAPVASLLLLLLVVPANFFTRFRQAGDSGGAGRVPIWTAGLQALKHFWVQGAGVDGFPAAYTRYAGFSPNFMGFERAAHNLYLCTGVELGIVGLVLLLLAIRSQFRATRYTAGEFDPFLVGSEAACWAVLVSAFFLDVLWRKYFWLSWILLTICTQVQRETRTRVDS